MRNNEDEDLVNDVVAEELKNCQINLIEIQGRRLSADEASSSWKSHEAIGKQGLGRLWQGLLDVLRAMFPDLSLEAWECKWVNKMVGFIGILLTKLW